MTLREFRNALCVLHSIDRYELVEAGVIKSDAPDEWWQGFRDYPVQTFLRMDDDKAEKLWALMQRRMP